MSSKVQVRPKKKQITPEELRARVTRALSEGKTKQALELARALLKQDTHQEDQELLRQACLERGRDLHARGYLVEARTVLHNALSLGGDPAYRQQLAQAIGQCGDFAASLRILHDLGSSPLGTTVFGQAVDQAIRQGAVGRSQLPKDWQSHYDVVVGAFAQIEAGHDDRARESLQAIGLNSPFLEWKTFLRGLLAYYANDDDRAVANWRRLDAQRLPARLAAPLRLGIDAAFAVAQPSGMQSAWRKQVDLWQGDALVSLLRRLQSNLAKDEALGPAFRLAQEALPLLRQQAPQLVSRLAACFYWAIIDQGVSEDSERYRLLFGNPPDDPNLIRLHALALEARGDFAQAHRAWFDYQKWVAEHPEFWPAGKAALIRAFIWKRMARNAERIPHAAALPPFLAGMQDLPPPLSPPADQCYLRSLELVPDQLDAWTALLHHYQSGKNSKKAEETARQLVQRFAQHAPTLETLGDLCLEKKDYAQARTWFERAVEANPLERSLRTKVVTALTYQARAEAEAGRPDQARALYQTALTWNEGQENGWLFCKWSAMEFKAENSARGEELLAQAKGDPLSIAFSMLIEAERFQLPRALKNRFSQQVNAGLNQAPRGQAAADMVATLAGYRAAGLEFHGQKNYEKKINMYLEKALAAELTEDQMLRISEALDGLGEKKLQRKYCQRGQRQFPAQPMFFLLEAEMLLAKGPFAFPPSQVRSLLDQARQLAQTLPRDARQESMQERIQMLYQLMDFVNPMKGLFSMLAGGFSPEDDDEFF